MASVCIPHFVIKNVDNFLIPFIFYVRYSHTAQLFMCRVAPDQAPRNDRNQTRDQASAVRSILSKCSCEMKVGIVAEWLALLPHSKKVEGLIPVLWGPFCVKL